MDSLKVAAIQADLHWEQPQKNLNYFSGEIKKLPKDVDLVVLPEMFSTGFSMNAAQAAEDEPGPAVKWMQEEAEKYQIALAGSLMIHWNERYYNRFYFVYPSGKIEHYDKRHLFSLAGENEVYEPGREHVIITYKNWKICPQVCYDLRFPVFSRNTQGYDLVIYVANWPEKRIQAWDVLLRARAIENMAFCIGVNRTGTDGNDYPYCGHSAIYDALGYTLAYAESDETSLVVTLEKEHLITTRKQLNFLEDRDQFLLKY
ncbi:MAG: amidohydrolase [Leeuwenhoekiella sp.]